MPRGSKKGSRASVGDGRTYLVTVADDATGSRSERCTGLRADHRRCKSVFFEEGKQYGQHVGPGVDQTLPRAVPRLKKNDLIGRIKAITMGVKRATAYNHARALAGPLKAPEIKSGNGIHLISGIKPQRKRGNAQNHTMINMINQAERTALTYPVQVTISPIEMSAIEASPTCPKV